jgi:anion-transporting  ArsA/GET3 family ATPase
MSELLARRLIVITGKGGTGKTTVATALGLLAAGQGLRTIVVEVGHQDRLSALFSDAAANPGRELRLQENLWTLSIDPDTALEEWLALLGGRVAARVLSQSGSFQYFAAAAPGAKELVSMVKLWELTESKRRRGASEGYDLVVLDAPATGHALAMLHSPVTFGAIARVGVVATQAQRVRGLLTDAARTSYLAVAAPTEMAVSETLQLQLQLRAQVGAELHAVVVNGVLPRRFAERELREVEALDDPAARAAAAAARAVHERARAQHNQVLRLRRRGDVRVVSVPFQFTAALDLQTLRRIAAQLGRGLRDSGA